ncbi:hypothetical protein JGU71_23100 [Antrihabitans sp. YC3-6]|uniref:Uncharacterized protein n=1 Tax=Antrihabitans stalagmiti TaxID=2799499 RepID=A0A934U6C6_9NOCA|nr:hypothetical protein [Antrihabitans stalagmiti]MBJ8341778.1 hypothetical protein [Antrihabitans stalagmiti]
MTTFDAARFQTLDYGVVAPRTARRSWRDVARSVRDYLRPSGYMGSSNPMDRDSAREFADIIAMSRRAPHN